MASMKQVSLLDSIEPWVLVQIECVPLEPTGVKRSDIDSFLRDVRSYRTVVGALESDLDRLLRRASALADGQAKDDEIEQVQRWITRVLPRLDHVRFRPRTLEHRDSGARLVDALMRAQAALRSASDFLKAL
jgi:hypothetical protein